MTNLINIVQGTKQYINVNVTIGTPSYTFKIYRATGFDIIDPTKFIQIEMTYVGNLTETYHQFIHIFDESIGNYTIKGEITDSCSLGPKIGFGLYNVIIYSPILTKISIIPANVSINVGSNQQLTDICKDQNNNAIACPTMVWSSSDPSKAVVDQTGLVTGVAIGSVNIIASSLGVTSNISSIAIFQNLLLNPGFETVDSSDPTIPQYWNKYKTPWSTRYNPVPWIYGSPGSGRDGIGRSISINFPNIEKGNDASWLQCAKVIPGTEYTVSGYMKTNTTGTGAEVRIDWFSDPCISYNYISSTVISSQTNTLNAWAHFNKTVMTPANAYGANILGVLKKGAKGKVSFDDIFFS